MSRMEKKISLGISSCFGPSNATNWLSRCSVIPWSGWVIWEKLSQENILHIIRSMPQSCQSCIQVHGGYANYWAPLWSAVMKFQQNGLARCIILSLWFLGCLSSALCNFHFQMMATFISNAFPNPHQYRYPAWIVPPLTSGVLSVQ